MERIRNLPFILGCIAAMVVGIVSYMAGVASQTIFIRMAVLMTIFFIIGVYIRNTILSIGEEVEEKEREKQRQEELFIRQEAERKKAEAEAEKYRPARKDHDQVQQEQPQQIVDLLAEDTPDEFEPMTVSRIISTKVKE